MKKTYLAPTVRMVPLKMQSNLLITSIYTNDDIGITGNGTVPYEFDEDDIR